MLTFEFVGGIIENRLTHQTSLLGTFLMNRQREFILVGGMFALTAVILGAFGAHALENRLESLGTVAVWQTAVDYQMWHALGILVIAISRLSGRAASFAMSSFCLGVPLFSGSLYWLALDGPRWLGPITPLGGLLLVIGWATLIVAAFKMRTDP